MRGLLTDPRILPGTASLELTPRRRDAGLSIVRQRKRPGHAFDGVIADAIELSVRSGRRNLPVIIARSDLRPLKSVLVALSCLPPAARALLRSVTLNPVPCPDDAQRAKRTHLPDFKTAMAVARGQVTVYPAGAASDPSEVLITLIHEAGHTFSDSAWGDDSSGPGWARWRKAMAQDILQVSRYAATNIDEDAAETFAIYCVTRHTPLHAEYRAMLPARFAVLDAHLRGQAR